MHTILIVDHEPVRLRATALTIEQKLGYFTITAATPDQAAHHLVSPRERAPDLLLLDLQLPDDQAWELIRVARQSRARLPIIAFVPFGSQDRLSKQVLRAGGTDVLEKPVTPIRLRLSIASGLLIRQLKDRVEQLERTRPDAQPRLHSGYGGVSQADSTLLLLDRAGRLRELKSVERDVLRFALRQARGSMTSAARSLGIGRSTLYRRLVELRSDEAELTVGQLAEAEYLPIE